MFKKSGFVFVVLLTLIGLRPSGFAQTVTDDQLAITATALDYVEGWYTGNAERMKSALHPDLVKRIAKTDPATGKSKLENLNAEQLVSATGKGFGTKTPKDNQIKEVKILDVFGNAVSVRADMRDWVDYMQMAKIDGQWKIVNVLWELRPKK